MNSVEVRSRLVEALQIDLIGPHGTLGQPEEALPQRPSSWYLTGFLVPIDAEAAQRTEETAEEQVDEVSDVGGIDDATSPEPASARRKYLPSSMGLSILIEAETRRLDITVRWGDYKQARAEDGHGGANEWRRTPKERRLSVEVPDKTEQPFERKVPDSGGLCIAVTVRPVHSDGGECELPRGTKSVSVFLVNRRKPAPDDTRDEGDVVDIFQGRYSGDRNYGIYLKGHAGDAFRAHRATRPGDVIDRPALAMALVVQPAAVRDLWNDPQAAGRGLLARFAVVLPESRIGHRDVRPDPVPPSARALYRSAIPRLLTQEPREEPLKIRLSREADDLYHAFQLRTEKALGHGDLDDRKAWGGKLCGLALRIALTLHALSTWAIHGRPEDFPEIAAETMQAAIAWADYLAAAERHARGLLTETDEERNRRELIEFLVKWKDGRAASVGISASELLRDSRRHRDMHLGVERVEAELLSLAKAGYGTFALPERGSTGRPKTRRFILAATGNAAPAPTKVPEPSEIPDSVGVGTPSHDLNEEGWTEI